MQILVYEGKLLSFIPTLHRRPSAPRRLYEVTGKHGRQEICRASHYAASRSNQSPLNPSATVGVSRNASSSAHIADDVAKQLNTKKGAFKYAVKKLLRESIQVNDHPGQAFVSSESTELRKMMCFIQFLTTPTVDTPGTALLLHFDEKRYLIGNIHEGLQRAGAESGWRFSKVTDIFLTGKTEWKSTGGLFGLILTLADAAESTKMAVEAARQKQAGRRERLQQEGGRSNEDQRNSIWPLPDLAKPTLNIHGGPNLSHSLASARRFIFRKSTPVNVFEHKVEDDKANELGRKPDWVDNHIQAWTLSINPSDGPNSASQSPTSRKRTHTEYAEVDFPRSLFKTDSNDSNDERKACNDQETRKHAVSEMFNSSWRIDDLEERLLSEVAESAQLFVRNPETKKVERYEPPPSDGHTIRPDINVLTRKAWPGALIEELPPSRPCQTALSYIIRNHRQRGKFMPLKAKGLNVQEGPLFAKLAAGESVQARDGKIVTPEMVLAEGKDGGGIAIVDLPHADYVENLIKRSEWQDSNIMTGVGGILWLLGAGVTKDERLQQFIRDHKSLEHTISSPDDCSNYLAFSSSAASAIRLSQINPRYFPIPIHNNNSPAQTNLEKSSVAAAQRGQKVQLEPSFEKKDDSIVPLLDTAKVLYSTPKEVLRLARVARDQIDKATSVNTQAQEPLPSEDAEITCLGTGSALPSKYRNVAGTLLRVPGHGSYLFDCGENTLGQLKRVYSPETLKEILHDLKLIWISHLHADHHLGTAAVIKAWHEEVHGTSNKPGTSSNSVFDESADPPKVFTEKDRLCIAGTHQMMQWLKEYASVEEYGYGKIIPLASIATHSESFIEYYGRRMGFRHFTTGSLSKTSQALQKLTGLVDLAACPVSHCSDAQAVALSFASGLKVSYSGDCRPSKRFAHIGRGSTLLIHEATFDDELRSDARAKKHSTTSEAIGVGLAMRARRVILTHFSQRYQKIPVMESIEASNVQLEEVEDQEVGIPLVDAETAEVSSDSLVEDITMGKDVNDDNIPPAETASTNSKDAANNDHSKSVPNDSTSSTIAQSRPQPNSSESSVPVSSSATKNMKVCVAFDYMKIKVGDIEHLEKLTPALMELYQAGDLDETRGNGAVNPLLVGNTEEIHEGKSKKGKKSNEQINRGKSKKDKSKAREASQPETLTYSGRAKSPTPVSPWTDAVQEDTLASQNPVNGAEVNDLHISGSSPTTAEDIQSTIGQNKLLESQQSTLGGP